MLKNLLAILAMVVLVATMAKMVATADLREEAWQCDRLLAGGYPTGDYCREVWAAKARLDGSK